MEFNNLPKKETVQKTIENMISRGFSTVYAESKEQALALIKEMIPAGSTIMNGASVTLDEIGFTYLLKSGDHSWINLKAAILAEPDMEKKIQMRRDATEANYFLGSVHAVTEEGVTVTASRSGSQLPAYAYNADNVVWVIGAQKIVPSLNDALERVREYVLPLEDERMKKSSEGKTGSAIAKLLIYELESNPSHRIHAIIVNEKLGF